MAGLALVKNAVEVLESTGFIWRPRAGIGGVGIAQGIIVRGNEVAARQVGAPVEEVLEPERVTVEAACEQEGEEATVSEVVIGECTGIGVCLTVIDREDGSAGGAGDNAGGGAASDKPMTVWLRPTSIKRAGTGDAQRAGKRERTGRTKGEGAGP